MRLVPYQTDEEITEKFTKYFEKIAPASVKVKVTPHHGGMPYVLPSDTKEFLAAKKAMEKAFGKKFYHIEVVEAFQLHLYLRKY
jgi:acetylornithine deacetylase/succinyl-diaminopimelate desuccinylase-like protein